ncbi:hypothetical protein ABK040_006775 [Willaertia magna]
MNFRRLLGKRLLHHVNNNKLLIDSVMNKKSIIKRNFISNFTDTLKKQFGDMTKLISQQDASFKQETPLLLPLSIDDITLQNRNDSEDEITIYVKGFLASHTSTSQLFKIFNNSKEKKHYGMTNDASHFQHWKHSHEILSLKESHKWNKHCFAWQWESGKLPHQINHETLSQLQKNVNVENLSKLIKNQNEKELNIPFLENNKIIKENKEILEQELSKKGLNPLHYLPLPVTTLASVTLHLLRSSRFLTPAAIPTVLLTDVIFTTAMLYYEFLKANENATEYAIEFSKELHLLRNRYNKIRIVGHSLGCKHIIEAIKLLPLEYRPDEIHLCAPAINEEDVKDVLSEGLAKDATFHYYSKEDYLLSYIFPIISQQKIALGAHPLKNNYNNTQSIQVCEHFDGFFVHNTYATNFHKFAESKKKNVK